MIVVEQKSFEEIKKMLQDQKKILLIGCDGCAGIYQVGGEKQAEVLRMLLEMTSKLEGVDIETKALSVIRQCDRQIVASTIRPLVENYDVILSLACGAGVQTLAEVFGDKKIVPANDTKFIGMQDRESGKFYELCSACGECLLFETGGICPVTRCAKGLLNGPCGGCIEGKCEVPAETLRDEKGNVVGKNDKDCAWYLIYNKLKKEDRLTQFRKYRPPRDRTTSTSPRQL